MDFDAFVWQQGIQCRPDAVDVDADGDVDDGEQLIVLAVKREIRGAQPFAEHVERAVGERHDVDDIGIAGGNLPDRRINTQHARFVQWQCEAGCALHGPLRRDRNDSLLRPNRYGNECQAGRKPRDQWQLHGNPDPPIPLMRKPIDPATTSQALIRSRTRCWRDSHYSGPRCLAVFTRHVVVGRRGAPHDIIRRSFRRCK